ncbi:MAG: OmpA family protein [Pseudohongiella sp.]|nr:OmpA family protein [Pseudohongiella sp.]
MNTRKTMFERHAGRAKKLLTLAAATLVLAACASAPTTLEGVAEVRNRLTTLRTNPDLATLAALEIQAAETAVRAAERPQEDRDLAVHYLLIADQKVEIANAWAQSRLYENQRNALSTQSSEAQLAARTREADMARSDAANARNQAMSARSDANSARSAADIARDQAAIAQDDANAARRATERAQNQVAVARSDANSAQVAADIANDQAAMARNQANIARAETEELQRQITELNAQMTDRGLVVTLGDVLFETGNAELRGGTPQNLNNLASFLNRFESRTVQIEGHTDSVGDDSSNMVLSLQRAESVQSYLVRSGVSSNRIVTTGKGEMAPIANNDTPTGRQQNRRVEVIISNAAE